MGSSSGEPSNKAIDPSVGALVWVRRRNGSWWPGRIVGLDDVSEGCLVSPRSGTPVKLLGREDASIDWYNLQKSKRVKAFRCGDYDACIERAKAAAASSNKKAVKYARREDAILHALEIESALLGKDNPDFYSITDTSVSKLDKESPTTSHSGKEVDDTSHGASDFDGSAPELSYSSMSCELNRESPSKLQTEQVTRGRAVYDSEDDGMEGSRRMRGLQDLGMGVASDKKVIELIQQDDGVLNDANADNCMVNGGAMNGGKGSSSSLKRKRSQVAYTHEFVKKKNRRRSVTKVLESTAMVSVPVTCEQFVSSCVSPLGGASESKISGLDSSESKRSLANNSESTGLSYENGAAVNDIVDHPNDNGHAHDKMKKEPSLLEPPENVLYDVPLNAEDKSSAGFPCDYTNGSFGRAQVGILGRQSSQSSQAEALQPEGINEYGLTDSAAAACYSSLYQRMEKSTSKWQSKGKRNIRHQNKRKRRIHLQRENSNDVEVSLLGWQSHPLKTKSVSESEDQVNGIKGAHTRKISDLKPLMTNCPLSTTPQSQRSLPHRQSRLTLHPRYQTTEYPVGSDPVLYDVELKANAKSSRASSDVPLVSLMSKLNGKPIIGHPLTVEALHDGYCNDLVNSEMGSVKLPPSMSRLRSSASKHAAKSKKNGLLSKKMRKLSSLTGQRKAGEDLRKPPLVEKQRSPIVACIPLKLVFSRLNEAVNGSLRPSHRLSASTTHM